MPRIVLFGTENNMKICDRTQNKVVDIKESDHVYYKL